MKQRRRLSGIAMLVSGLALAAASNCGADPAASSVEIESVLVPGVDGVWRIKKTWSGDAKHSLFHNAGTTPITVRSNDGTAVVIAPMESAVFPCDTRSAYRQLFEADVLIHSVVAACGDVIHLTNE